MSDTVKRILIVDDQDGWLECIAGVLGKIECSVDFAKTFNEAQTKLKNEHFDLSIIDMRLREQDEYDVQGIDLLQWIYNVRKGQPPAIILTGHLDDQSFGQFLK